MRSTGPRPSWVARPAACGIAGAWDEDICEGGLGVFLRPQPFVSLVFCIRGCPRLSWSSASKSKGQKIREVPRHSLR